MSGIFISYRRGDVAGQAGRLFDYLSSRFGEDRVFMDVESLTPSEHFDAAIERAIGQCDVVLAAIGPGWVNDRSRLDDPKDFVRSELATALRLERPIIPLLIDDARMPQASDLPAELQGLVRNQAFEVRHRTFRRDVDELVKSLQSRFIRPADADRRRLENAMQRSGWPFSWFAAVSRWSSPAGAVFLLAVLLPASIVAVISAAAFGRGWIAGREAEEIAVRGEYEVKAAEHRKDDLVLKGLVSDGVQVVEDAEVKLTNVANGLSRTARTNPFGQYTVDLKSIDVSEDAIIKLDVTKTSYQPFHDEFAFRDGIQYRAYLRGRR